jgi:hypothetical protein
MMKKIKVIDEVDRDLFEERVSDLMTKGWFIIKTTAVNLPGQGFHGFNELTFIAFLGLYEERNDAGNS